jgi:hypothetical protein
MTAAEWIYLICVVSAILITVAWLLWIVADPQSGCTGDCEDCKRPPK